MIDYFAHSPKGDKPAQTYEEHINGVLKLVRCYASDAARYSVVDNGLMAHTAETAAVYHDLGKLDSENQFVLSGRKSAKSLPLNHTDAGAAYLLNDEHTSVLAAVAVASHHIGLPDFVGESIREDNAFRDDKIKAIIDAALPMYAQIHDGIIKTQMTAENAMPKGDKPVFFRVLLSCLTDADHTDTAIHYGKYPDNESHIALKAKERLAALDAYVANLGNANGERDQLRGKIYAACKNAEVKENIVSCDSPVGSGKTTAVMANLLAQAQKRGLRRIFVVLPFTNIIKQSVEVYRKALVLPGENPNNVVAELHHNADFESEDIRHLTALWRAPIVVTTAVAFFETLSSNSPSTLRRLHELPGSAIFIDEAHAALPARLLPVAWSWINTFANEWSCYWALASGSLTRFWKIKEISGMAPHVPEIVDESLRVSLGGYERNRITYTHDLLPKSINDLADQIRQSSGPRLVILNTVQSASVAAKFFLDTFGEGSVEHLSTALTPDDRATTLKRVKKRLKLKRDKDWTLVATSCVEAGVDLSFCTGFRELGSLTSLLQASGRINRNGEYGVSEMHTFCLAENEMLKSNPRIKNAATVLREYLERGVTIEPSLVTDAIEKEIKLYGIASIGKKLIDKEKEQNYPFVNDNFKVIDNNTRLAVVDEIIADKIRSGHINWRELQQNSVQIAHYKLSELRIPQIADGIYSWNLSYDKFIGYMSGVIDVKKYKEIPII
ncbi:MAG: CRISPR-associated endonuclease Cas3'' [Clostridiales bacterium]|jgi:CRISPR-associated endonuclease/helicase Cas3|nr:CRISPR-associated endonuclease Cas3'' [Clostridiales bacterium]